MAAVCVRKCTRGSRTQFPERPHFRGPTSKEGPALTSQRSTELATYSVLGYGRDSLGLDQRNRGTVRRSRASRWECVFRAPCIVSGAPSRQGVISGRFVPVPSGFSGYVNSTIRLYSAFQYSMCLIGMLV